MKIVKYIGMLLLAGLCHACGNDWLDTEPSTSVDSELFPSTLKEYGYSVNGIYDLMQSYYYYGARMQYYGDVTGDDMQSTSSSKRTANYYLFNFSAANVPSTFWRTCYSIIRECNRVLEHIDELAVNEEEGEDAVRDDLKGQALAIRALALFDLTRLYGYPYMKDKGASLGVAVVDKVVEIDHQPKRNTVAECYKAIIDDLNAALPLLKTKRTQGKINRWGAMTLLSRVYLYKGDDANAFKTATEGIEGAEKNGFQLWTNEEYVSAWAEEFGSEVFFEIVNLLTDSPGKEAMGYLCWSKGYKDLALTSSFMDFLLTDKDDVRSKLYTVSSKFPYITKYPGEPGDGNPEDANIKIFRLSELYLNAAEAAQKLGDNDNAVKYLDVIVKRGNPDRTVQGTTVTLKRVLDERRKEFFGEGQRMFDLIRNGLKVERVNGTTKTYKPHLTDLSVWEFDWNYYKVVLAIPKAELDANPNMAGQQNPGY